MIDRIRNTSVFCYALVCEVDLAFCVNSNVFQQGVALDGVVDIGFAFLVEVDRPKKIAESVPSMFVLAEQCIEAMPRSGFR